MATGAIAGMPRYGVKNRSLIYIATWLLVLASGVPATSLAAEAGKTTAVDTLSTVIVNGVPIAEEELSREVNRLAPVAEYHNLSSERWQAIRKQAIDNIVDKELFYREAIQRGINWDEQWVEFTYEKTRQKYTADNHARLALDDEKVKNRLYEDLRRSYVISKLWQQGRQASTPTEQEIEAYFMANREKYRSPKSMKIVELLLEMKPSSAKSEWDQAKKLINSIYRQARKDKGFAAYQKGQPGLKITDRTIHEGMQGYDIRELDKLADGEISKPLFTLKGFVLLKKVKSIPQQDFEFAEVREQVKNDLLNMKYQTWFDTLREDLRDKAKIIIGAGPAYVGR